MATFAQASDFQATQNQEDTAASTRTGSIRDGGAPKTLAPAPKAEIQDLFVPKPDRETSHLDEAFDSDCLVLPSALAPKEGRFQPMIQELETGFAPSAHFTEMAETLALMNKLAYSRGQDYRHGHELTYQDVLEGWTLKNIKAVRGFNSCDPNAGFVAHNKKLGAVAIVMHGSINTGDWFTNLKTHAVRLDAVYALPRKAGEDADKARTVRLPFVGYAHSGFLEKYLSCQEEVMAAVDEVMTSPDLTPEEKRDLKFYVSGHSQGAALGQLLTLQLCFHLRKHFGPEFINARDNRVHAWLLASPTGLDETAVAFAEGWIGKANVVVQNTWLDIVPNAGSLTCWPGMIRFKAMGTPIMQSSEDAVRRSAEAHRKAVQTHYNNGDYKEAAAGAL